MPIVISVVIGMLLIAAPVVCTTTGHPLGALPSAMLIGAGLLLLLGGAILLIVTRLYARARADEAFVRTGMGGLKVVKDGGALVLPVLHEIVRVSLATIKLEIDRKDAEALITDDKLRADIRAEFFVRVQPDTEAIQSAARSLGEDGEGSHQACVRTLLEDKLVSALRTAAARKTLEQLNSDRDEFLKEVVNMVTDDLKHNGFTLESVTISKLDQTGMQFLKVDNIFDAQGSRTIAEITQSNLTLRNEIVRRGEQERAAQDVAARQRVLELERTRAEAEATQATQVASVNADQDRISKERQIEAARLVQVAEVERIRSIEVAQQAQQRDIAVADQERLKSITEAQQKLEVAKRAQEKAIAEAEAQRALAQAKLADAEAERTKAQQQVITAEQIATAERERQKNVLSATALAEQAYVKESKAADAAAYKVKADAEARKASADADAEATRKKAEADAASIQLRAEGERAAALARATGDQAGLEAQAAGQRAVAMVPVDVAARQVEIDKARVETVLVPELEAREKSGKAAQEFELSQLRISKEAEVRVEASKAMVTLYGKINANIFGTPEDVSKMGGAYMNGMGLSNLFSGFIDGANNSPDLMAAIQKAGEMASRVGLALTDKVSPPNQDG